MHPTLAAGPRSGGGGGGVDYWQSMSKGGVENGVPIGRRGDRMAHRIRIHDIEGVPSREGGWCRPLRTAIAVIVATAMLTPTIASAAPVVPDAPSPVPGVESSSPYADDGVTYTADGRPLYESASDTIYIYNALQTAVSRQDDAADQPVLTGDGDAETFGTGQPIYAEDSDEPLTYSPEHTYVYVDGWDEGLEDAGENNGAQLMAEESADTPAAQEEPDAENNDDSATDSTTTGESGPSDTDESTAAQDAATIAGAEVLSDGEDGTTGKMLLADERAVGELDGRDYVGQTVKNINGTDYILIGNEQQLRAIGTNKHVTDKVWYRFNSWDEWELKYGGDADLAPGEELADDEYVNKHYGDVLDRDWAGTNEDGTPAKHNPDTGLTYSSSANYIIFRNIDVSAGGDWTPLMFTGTMFGSKSATGTTAGSLWDYFETEGTNSGISDISIMDGADSRPKISNVDINQDSPISTDKQSGVGFFASLYSESEISSDSLGKSKGKVRVSGIILDGVHVTTRTTKTVETETLVSTVSQILGGLLGFVGDIVGGILDALLGWAVPGLGDLKLGDVLRNLFNLHNSDPSVFATGAFAGRIVGDVEVEHCTAVDVLVSNANSMTGGFVGYIEGQPQYSILDKISGELINTLTQILNAIPGLGLGDLITLLLDNNILKLNNLIPIGYYRPVISDCDVDTFVAAAEGGTPTIGLETTSFAGGFAGVQIGAIIEGSRVESEGALQINAKEYAGGFVGLMRDGEVQGLLENLGVKLVDLARPQSLAYESTVHVATLSVAAADKHAGGFTGATAASHLVNSSVQAKTSLNVKAPLYAGGLVGEATMGWITNLGADEGDKNLLKSLAGIVTGLVGQDNSGQLLALMGFDPSTILGGSVIGGSVTVASTSDYAGGMVGKGEGATIASSTADQVQKLTFWQTGERYAGTTPATRGNLVLGLSQVQSGGSYAGGIAGAMETASVGGLLNGVLGIGSLKNLAGGGFTAFEVSDTRVNDASAMQELVDGKALWIDSTIAPNGAYTVTAEGYSVGGAIGCATGGTVDNVSVHGLSSVKAVGEAGGFIGQAAAGDVLGSDGVNLLGLVKLSGLLSVAQSTRLTVDDSTVTGIDDAGFTVTAKEGDSSATTQHTAGGFYGRASSTETSNSHVANLAQVTAPSENGLAGGFVGLSTTGGLASVVSDEDEGGSVLGDLFDKGLLSVDDLLGAVPYMVPSYRCTDVTYVAISDGYNVKGDVAGGYAGLFESGEVNVFDEDHPLPDGSNLDDLFAVRNIASVYGEHYAGGFAGKAVSGSLAEAGGGLSLLGGAASIDLTKLLNLVQAYVPVIRYADVLSEDGFTVETAAIDSQEQTTSGAAGGFIGYGTAVQVSYSDVSKLAHTAVAAPDDLEAKDALSYFDSTKSTYAVTAPQYAGGYFGYLDIGSTAGVASGLELLKNSPVADGLTRGISVSDLTSALNVMASTVEHSNVYGHAGGFSVLANGKDSFGAVGHAGGFAGKISGGQIQDCNVDNFAYIIGQIAAGGYAGELVPGSVADVLGEATMGANGQEEHGILDGLADVSDLASVAQAFVPTIRNSETTCVPCGGAVRAQAFSKEEGTVGSDGSPIIVQRGMAGGYVGHNVGGQIWGNNNAAWKNESADGSETGTYTGPQREAAAIRIRSVYGAEYAGGFTGLMEPGSTAETGGLSLLWGLIDVNNLLKVMQDIYPTEENTAVYGPLRELTVDEWNAWVDAVGENNVYGELLGEKNEAAASKLAGHVSSEEEIAAWLAKIGYGTNVVAGRDTYEAGAYTGSAGVAGGYVGSMVAGTITNGQAHDTKLVRAMRAAGGFVGAAETGGAAKLGSADILDISLDLDKLLPSLVSVFVPVIKCSSVTGYRQGMTVESFGSAPADDEGQHETDTKNGTGFAGGYIGFGSGAQIWGDADTARDGNAQRVSNTGCTVSGLRRVSATAYAGGFAGKLGAASVASADTNISDGFLQGLLDTVISGTGISELANVLKISMSTVRNAHVKAYDEKAGAGDEQWGFTIDAYTTGEGDNAQKVYPIAAGGFAGSIEATVLGELTTSGDDPDAAGGDNLYLPDISVSGLRGVDGGNFAGGLVGLADVAGAADVASGDTEGAGASVLKLIGIGGVSVLQAFQPCIYAARVDGVADGLTVRAHEADTGGLLTAERRSGNAGGFIGSIMSGVVRESSLTNLSTVSGPSYTGGFIGYTGKSGVVDVEKASALAGLLGLDASALNTFSTLVQNSTVAGIPAGYTVASTGNEMGGGEDAYQMSGGFVGHADLAHISGCHATALKRVGSGEVAGGFAGKGTHAYLVSAEADSPLVDALLMVVLGLVKALWLDELQETGLVEINLADWVLHLQVERNGNTLSLNLLGIPITVTLVEEHPDNTAVAEVHISNSVITLNVKKDKNDNVTFNGDEPSVDVDLIKANMTVIENSSVTGIADGYDVFAGGATQTSGALDSNSSDAESGFAGGFMGWSDEAQLKDNEMLYADVVKGTTGLVAPFVGRTDYVSGHIADTIDHQINGNTYHVYRGTELADKALNGNILNNLEDGVSASITGALDNGDPNSDDTPTSAADAAWARFDIAGHKVVANSSNHDDWKDVKAGDTPINVWQDEGATAVLMANATVNDNTGALTPEPEEGQDPCAATADLTITKVWDDHGDTAHRPDSITVELWQSYTNASGKTEKKYDGTLPNGSDDGSGIASGDITLSAAEASPWSNTWQHVVKMLPVAWRDADGNVHYFSYSVKEVKLNGGKDIADYSTTITPGEDGMFHIVITNRLPLPETGGMGTHWFAILGVLLVGVGILLTRKDTYGRGTGRHRAAR